MNEEIQIFDTTLRDGEQAPGYSMNLDEKVRMALQLEALGVDAMEVGFAAASPGDFASVKAVADAVRMSTVCSLSRALERDIEALEAEKKQIEEALCGGTTSVDEITKMSKRLPLLNDELDEKSMRWLELSEVED